MEESLTQIFINALSRLESSRDLKTIVALFADSCEVGNVTLKDNFQGIDGAQEFWTNYRDTFDAVSSEFRNQIELDGKIALEWVTKGTAKNGHEIIYEGVSILEIEGQRIKRFFAYFDPAKIGHQITDEEGGK